ncbi:hypothetical protein FQA39_LY11485 [Lamprigera yunnana]|nr:hypothetical protein FQA39_LY11485 [Lamprigera yunnana]
MSGVAFSTSTTSSVYNTNTGGVELTESGGRALKLQTDTPHLVSLGGGRLSTAVTLHPIPPGRITLGSSPGVDITVQGTGVEPLHCHIENVGGIVTLYPLSENLSIDGVLVSSPTRLSQGVMLMIGRSNYMRFNHPAEAQLMKSVLPNTRISMTPIRFDLENQEEHKYTKKPPTIPRKNSRDSINDEEPPSNIQMKVSKFEYLAAQNFKKSISPKVFSSNLVTVNTPAKDVLGRAPPDLQDFAKNLPQPAVNYSDSSFNDKEKNKIPDRNFFGRKSPQYVNVAINDAKTINNRVAVYENGCVPKHHNVYLNLNLDQQPKNELNNMNNKTINTSHVAKPINVNRTTPSPSFNRNPSPSYNRNPLPYARSVTSSPTIPNSPGTKLDRRSGSFSEINKSGGNLEDVIIRNNEAEVRRNQAHADRVKEQEIEKAEQARLEEILNMCAEYERQVQWEKTNKPIPNRIKTNGSLPRDKRQCPPSPFSSSPGYLSPASTQATPSPNHMENTVFRFDHESRPNNHNYENVTISNTIPRDTTSRFYYENVEIYPEDNISPHCVSQYENIIVHRENNTTYPQSPRTRIKTIPTPNKDSSAQIIETKFSVLNTEQYLLQSQSKEIPSENKDNVDVINRKPTPTKLIPSIDNYNECRKTSEKIEANRLKMEALKQEKQEILAATTDIKRKMADIEMQEEELNRELEMERALIAGEHKSKLYEIENLEKRKQFLLERAREIEKKMEDCQVTQAEHQETCRQKLEAAQDNMSKTESELSETSKGSQEYQDLFEEFLKAQELLDNERKTFEDLEFHHLEEEADWLASREEIQREILDLSKRLDQLKVQVNELEQQKVDTSTCNAQESKTLERQLIKYLRRIEEYRNKLKTVEEELSLFSQQESDQEVSSDSDTEKVNGEVYDMSKSFSEKMLQERFILEDCLAKRSPSQDDIDRISKVTSSAPMNIEDERGSLGRKTIESLKEIERNRQLHLVQQGSQVIEEERRRVLALKQRAQDEVRTQWAQRQQDCCSFTSTGSDDIQNSVTGSEEADQKLAINNRNVLEQLPNDTEAPKSPRPLSETSDISVVELGGTLGKRRGRQNLDKTRPLTRYLPIRSSELDLRQHIETAGHQVVLCPHVTINSTSCRGFLHKRGSKLNGWSRRWFVFDRIKRALIYYTDKSEKKVRGGAYFQAIEEVYLDHSNSVKSPSPQLTFIVKTRERYYYLMAPSPEAMRIWIDVVFTGAEGYQEFKQGT